MAFDDEGEAFEAYARALPNNCLFLVDTYDTLEGVRKAISVGRRLKERGSRLLGIRLDSGDLAYLSIEARKLLDAAGFPDAKIVASNDLDEGLIASLKEQGAKIAVWGVGTKLATAYDQPALGGIGTPKGRCATLFMTRLGAFPSRPFSLIHWIRPGEKKFPKGLRSRICWCRSFAMEKSRANCLLWLRSANAPGSAWRISTPG